MSGNFAIKGGGGVGRLMANAILNFHFYYPHPSLTARLFPQWAGLVHEDAEEDGAGDGADTPQDYALQAQGQAPLLLSHRP